MKKINLPQKGEPDYLFRQKKLSTIKTLISYAVAVAIFIIGYLLTKTRENVFSVIAVLALLPASRNTVSMIMFLKTPAYNADIYNKILKNAGNVPNISPVSDFLSEELSNYLFCCKRF